MMTTIDLLLTLGGKIADVLATMLQKKISDKERENAEKLVRQYDELKNTHSKISIVVQNYNQGIVRAIAIGSLQSLFPLCTHNGYKRTENLYRGYLEQDINQLLLDQLQILSINLTIHTTQELQLLQQAGEKWEQAQVFTHETWISSSLNGARYTQEVINHYWLLSEGSTWKVDSTEVYVKSRYSGRGIG